MLGFKLRAVLSIVVVSTALAIPAMTCDAGELRYQFRNPAFGGNPFLSDFLLQTAQIQNEHAGGGDGGGGGGGGGAGGDPFSDFNFPDPDDFATGTTVIIGAPDP